MGLRNAFRLPHVIFIVVDIKCDIKIDTYKPSHPVEVALISLSLPFDPIESQKSLHDVSIQHSFDTFSRREKPSSNIQEHIHKRGTLSDRILALHMEHFLIQSVQ